MRASQPFLYANVIFRFWGGDDPPSELSGDVRIDGTKMVLDVEGPEGPYLITGKQKDHWYKGVNASPRNHETEAKWAFVDGTYVGIWIEEDWEYIFAFTLREPLK